MSISKTEIKNFGVQLLWSIAFFFIAFELRDWLKINVDGNSVILIAIGIIIFLLWKFDFKMPINFRR